ncbi:YlxM family DNA-binding protein [Natroniella sp. ANB-PHB2]|uniref:YlxM family DNA-binding protein n=1 Tax=Natroniella sp. ANB-PHB2 TaxID=3384444 RepID=UPI0038D4BCE3
MKVEKVIKIGKLFGFYASLLTERQQEFMRLYYYHDLSLGEIAQQKSVTRQAVYDNLKRSEYALQEYEKKLNLVKHYDKVQSEIDNLGQVIEQIESRLELEEVESLRGILDRLQTYQKGELM